MSQICIFFSIFHLASLFFLNQKLSVHFLVKLRFYTQCTNRHHNSKYHLWCGSQGISSYAGAQIPVSAQMPASVIHSWAKYETSIPKLFLHAGGFWREGKNRQCKTKRGRGGNGDWASIKTAGDVSPANCLDGGDNRGRRVIQRTLAKKQLDTVKQFWPYTKISWPNLPWFSAQIH